MAPPLNLAEARVGTEGSHPHRYLRWCVPISRRTSPIRIHDVKDAVVRRSGRFDPADFRPVNEEAPLGRWPEGGFFSRLSFLYSTATPGTLRHRLDHNRDELRLRELE